MKLRVTVTVLLMLLSLRPVLAQDQQLAGDTSSQVTQQKATSAELAYQLANPISSLISVPFQFNYDQNIGPTDDGWRTLVNLQPVVPFELSRHWNIISRTILPIVYQEDILPDSGSQFGISDTIQSLFFSPARPTSRGWIWGAGPVFLLPTATDRLLGSGKWGVGPTLVALKQKKGWTYGVLTNHIWSVSDSEGRADVNSTFIQPFLAYTTSAATTYSINSESIYDWESEQWSVPINATVTQLTNIGKQPVSIGGGVRYWASSTDNGPEGWGFRLIFTLLYPRQ